MDGQARQRREDLFARIASGKGGAAALLLSPEVIAAAEAELETLRPLVVAEIRGAVDRIRALADHRAAPDDIFAAAHDVRGLAGTYGFGAAGVAAGALRAYGESRGQGFQPDWPLLQLLAQTLARTFEDPGAAAPELLAGMCREAVAKVMTREGRELPEGAF